MTAAIVFCVACVALGGGVAHTGIGRILDRDEPVQGVVDLALCLVVVAAGATALLKVLP